MKCHRKVGSPIIGQSPPSRGAWIEIAVIRIGIHDLASPPSRGAWIEINMSLAAYTKKFKSPPSRGAWIEIERAER